MDDHLIAYVARHRHDNLIVQDITHQLGVCIDEYASFPEARNLIRVPYGLIILDPDNISTMGEALSGVDPESVEAKNWQVGYAILTDIIRTSESVNRTTPVLIRVFAHLPEYNEEVFRQERTHIVYRTGQSQTSFTEQLRIIRELRA